VQTIAKTLLSLASDKKINSPDQSSFNELPTMLMYSKLRIFFLGGGSSKHIWT